MTSVTKKSSKSGESTKKSPPIKKQTELSPSNNIEDGVRKVLEDCKSIVQSNKAVLKNKPNLRPNAVNYKTNKNQEITLDSVTKNMSNVLKDLKESLLLMKNSKDKDSFSDVVTELEQTCQKTNSFFKKEVPTNNINKNAGKKNTTQNAKSNNKKVSNNNNQKPKNVVQVLNKQKTPPKSAPSGRARTNSAGGNSINSVSRPQSANANRKNNQNVIMNPTFAAPPREVYNPLGILKDQVKRAIRDRKTFTVRGCFPAVRKALLQRGWIEKFHITYKDVISNEMKQLSTYSIQELGDLLRNKDITETCKKLIKSKMLKEHQVDLYWDYSYESFRQCNDKIKLTLINKFRRDVFSYTSKQGLCEASQNAYWYQIPGVSNINHPRSYVLAKNGDTKTFIKDFNITAAMSLLKWVVRNHITNEIKIMSPSGKIPVKVFDFAVTECYKFVKKARHEDIDFDIPEAMEHEWNEFLSCYYKTVHIGNHFKSDENVSEAQIVRKANYVLNKLKEYWPYFEMDGMMNIWILKPINSSRGVGIHICRTLDYILKVIQDNQNRRYVIQKYIERPLLIHDTKFDIRQWFLISSATPVTIWMYKSCYLRFSSQTYNLRKLHESIHLTNNSVQAKYQRNAAIRDISLPSYNMWDSTQFKDFLSNIGYPRAFEDIIYPGMKQCVVAAVLAHQDKIDRRRCCFELYGADFMLTEDFSPWLLEINSNPALHASTPVTARMCPRVLEDVIKVVVDFSRNNKASTGDFELIYKGQTSNDKAPPKQLQVTGTPLTETYFFTPSFEKTPDIKETKCSSMTVGLKLCEVDPCERLRDVGDTMRKTLENLLEMLQKEKMRRLKRKSKATEVDSTGQGLETYTQTLDEKKGDFIEVFKGEFEKTQSKHSRQQIREEMSQMIANVINKL